MAVGTIAILALVLASGAQATQRYASPTGGTGPECPQATPCSLKEAVEGAKAGDEVIVGGGTYVLSEGLFLPGGTTNVQVHGDTSGPMPRITGTLSSHIALMGEGEAADSISYLEFENDANEGVGVYCTGGQLERVRVRVAGFGGIGAFVFPGCTSVRNSLLLAEGSNSTALRVGDNFSGNYTLAARGLTAIASGNGSTGASVEFGASSAGSATLELENSIVRGGEQDLKATGNVNGVATATAIHSNYVTFKPGTEGKLVDGGGNQTAAPLFVNAEARDYREAAGSPTIDAGLAGELGALDLAGNPRVEGAAPDIGAYEFVPPATPAATGGVRTLSIKPKKFRAFSKGGPVAAKALKGKPPVGATVTYTTTGPATVQFSVSRKIPHSKKYTPVKGSFTQTAAAGSNHFVFSGRIGGRALKPGAYKLTAFAGHLISEAFEIAGPPRRHRHG
jgi:hypothetical protein